MNENLHAAKRLAYVIALCLAAPALAETKTAILGNSKVQIIDGAPRKIIVETIAPLQEDIRILGRRHMNRECRLDATTNYQLVQPPIHGVACYRDENAIGKLTAKSGPTPCLGTISLMRMVYYRPDGAYVGQDAFQYEISNDANAPEAVAHVSVTVTPPASPISQSLSSAPAETSQKSGPMPRCPEPVT